MQSTHLRQAIYLLLSIVGAALPWWLWPWIYLVLGNLIAVACIFPMFLLFRERHLARAS